MGRKLGVSAHFWERGAGSPSNNVAWTEAYLPTKCHLNSHSHLATADMAVSELSNKDVRSQYWPIQHHIRLIVIMAARCFSPLLGQLSLASLRGR